jgi:YHS domain-containing protein
MRHLIKTTIIAAAFFAGAANAANEPVSTSSNGVAAGGHDVTAYKNLNRSGDAVSGSASFTATYKGATWQFVRKEDRDRFEKNPGNFTPAFNGHCANALALGEGLIPTTGKSWLILDDQLYFFFAPRGAKRWSDGNHKRYLAQAMSAWTAITKP